MHEALPSSNWSHILAVGNGANIRYLLNCTWPKRATSEPHSSDVLHVICCRRLGWWCPRGPSLATPHQCGSSRSDRQPAPVHRRVLLFACKFSAVVNVLDGLVGVKPKWYCGEYVPRIWDRLFSKPPPPPTSGDSPHFGAPPPPSTVLLWS
jgi:hypothetical protein